ncbi:MAG TPA: hypothetical protein VF681_12470 [Abditibacteriaceae bacterium]|jgi:hypothetical protein
MKLINEPMHVQTAAEGKPARIYWNNRPFRILDLAHTWHYAGKWWIDRNVADIHRTYYRVMPKVRAAISSRWRFIPAIAPGQSRASWIEAKEYGRIPC